MLERARCDEDGCEATWWDTTDNSPVLFDAVRVEQKSRVFYQATLPGDLLDAMCEVPSVPEDAQYDRLADLCLGGMKEWQRQRSADRVAQIGQFWAQPGTQLVNPPVVAFKEDWEVEITDVKLGSVTSLTVRRVSVSPWFLGQCPSKHPHLAPGGHFTTSCPTHGCHFHDKPYPRPAVVIDGQHRIGGVASERPASTRLRLGGGGEVYASDVVLPVVILSATGPSAFDSNTQARIFTEITTLGEDLHYLHKLWLIYRFPGMRANIPELDALPQPISMDSGDPYGKNVRAAYESILWMAGTSLGAEGITNPWRNRIPIFKHQPAAKRIGSVDRLLPMLYRWVRAKGPLNGKLPQQIATELIEFTRAIIQVWDRQSPLGKYYWIPPQTEVRPLKTGDRGIISHPEGGAMSTWLRALLRLLPAVYDRLPAGITSPTRADFVVILDALKDAQLEGPGWEDFPGQETKENLLFEILESYLTGGRVVTEMGAHGIPNLNDYVSRPPLSQITVSGAGKKGTRGRPLVNVGATELTWDRPFSTLGMPAISVSQEGVPTPIEAELKADRGAPVKFTLVHGSFDESASGSILEVRIRHYNHVAPDIKLFEFEVP